MGLDMLETQILNLIKIRFSDKIKDKKEYADLTFTTSDKVETKPKFPTVYISMIDSPEKGKTLSANSLNFVDAAFQIEVSDNQNNKRTDEISREVLRIMVSVGFQVLVMPTHKNTEVYRTVSRYLRTTGTGDVL